MNGSPPPDAQPLPADLKDFLLQEYQAYREAMNESERSGEGRVNLLLTITTAVLGLLTLKHEVSPGKDFDALFLFLFTVVFLLGLATLARMVHRKRVSIQMKNALARLRAYFCKEHPGVEEHLEWRSDKRAEPPTIEYYNLLWPKTGGLVDTTALLNSAIFGALAFQLTGKLSALLKAPDLPAWGMAVAGFLVAWVAQIAWVRHAYGKLGGS